MSKKREKADELDLTSPNFNPVKALEEPKNVKIPYESAPTYDNITSFVETPDGIFPKPKREPKKDGSRKSQAGPSVSQEDRKKEAEERINNTKNVISRMENTIKGPLSFIKKCLDEKLRVKVFTRSAVTVRGFCLGFIVAFDKHWNLVLKDVFETWTRRRKRKVPFLGPVESDDEQESDILSTRVTSERHKEQIKAENKSNIIVRKRLKRREICERHVDQLLIRGEQIVIVTLEPS